MNSLKERISRLQSGEFGPHDPRTSSLGSTSGGSLSFENQRKLLEQELSTLTAIEHQRATNAKERQMFWSDPAHLRSKLDGTLQAVAALGRAQEFISENFAIVEGTGEVVMKFPDATYHYVDIQLQNPENPVYVSPKATLPEKMIPKLRKGADLGV